MYFLEKEGIYQYTINESAVMQKSFEFYIKQIYEHYNLMKKYLETNKLKSKKNKYKKVK